MPLNEDAFIAAASAAPELDPQSAYGISQVNRDPSLAAESAVATHGMAQTLTTINVIRRMDPDKQRKVWDRLSPQRRRLWSGAGYVVPPAPEHHHQSLFGKAIGSVGHAASKVVGGPVHFAQESVTEGLHALGAPLRQVQHVYRAAALVTEKNLSQGEGKLNPGTPSEWAQAWRDSEHGERTYIPSRVTEIGNKYGEDVAATAQRLASGDSPEKILASVPENERAATYKQMNSPKMQLAIEEFQNAKISFGRRMVGQHLFQSDPKLAHRMSGAFDATADIFADPVIWGGKIAKAAELAPYLAKADNVGKVLRSPGAQRMLEGASEALSKGDAGALIRFNPRFSPIAEQLIRENVRTTAELTDWFKGDAGLKALIEGHVGGLAPHNLIAQGSGEFLVPHLSRAGAAAIPVHEAAAKTIRWGSEHHIPITTSLDRITKLRVPAGMKLDMANKDALTTVQRIAEYALPKKRADEFVSLMAAAPDPAAQYLQYKGMLSEVFDGLRVPKQWRENFFGGLEEHAGTHAYGVGDKLMLDGEEAAVGFTRNHVMDQGWTIPDFRALRMQADKAFIQEKLYGVTNGAMSSGFMRIWKPAQLLRIGFPIRVAGEELVAAVLRDGVVGLARGRVAASVAKRELSVMEGDAGLFSRALNRMTSHLSNDAAARIKTPGDLAGEVLGNRTSRAMAGVKERLLPERYVDAARRAVGVWSDGLAHEVSSVHGPGAGFLDDVPKIIKTARDGAEMRPMQLAANGDRFRGYSQTDPLQTLIWHKNLDEYAQDPFMRAAFGAADQGEAAQVQAVFETLNDPAHSFIVGKAGRSRVTLDGRVVGDGATKEEALRDWAQVITHNANELTHDATGVRFDHILDSVRSGKAPELAHLNEIPNELRPAMVSGPDLIETHGASKYQEIQTKGFEYAGRMIDWIAREPMFIHHMAESVEEVGPAIRRLYGAGIGSDTTHIEEHINEVAFQHAIDRTIPFIHDPKVRSQFAEDLRNLTPFMFAQEQFIKRWARTAAYSPHAFRKAQLAMMGLRHSGLVKKDENGNDFFMYPGANMTQKALSAAVSKITGHDIMLPVPVGFSGQVQFATPGTERIGAPSWGPLVAMPMHALTQRFPELAELEQAVVGERGAGRPYWEQIAPASVARVAHAFIDNPEMPNQMHSATLQAIQYLESTGHGLPDGASSIQQEHYIDRVKSWARVLMFTRAIFGFSVPAAPEMELDPKHLNAELRGMIRTMPIDQAIQEFMQKHPDATAYTVFQTKSESGAPLPATTEAVAFMVKHGDFLRNYPQAGAWFLPQKSKDNKFSMPAYREQLGLELRKHKTLGEFYTDVKFAEAATDYFDTRDGRDAAIEQAGGNRALVQQINQQWTEWHNAYLTAHPIFHEQLQSPDGRIRRQRALSQLRQALADPALPKTKQTGAIRDLSDTYDGYNQYISQFTGRRDRAATEGRKIAKTQFIDWARDYTKEHPEVQGLYDRVFRLEVGDEG